MRKRGMLLAEETLKIVVALLGISFLVIFLTSLYFSNLGEKKLNEAQQELINSEQSVKALIDKLNEGDEKSKNLVSPIGWSLFSFSGETPNSCIGDCACICDGVTFGNQVNECSENGACLDIEGLVLFNEIKITNPSEEIVNLSIKKEGGRIFFSTSVGTEANAQEDSEKESSNANPSKLEPQEILVAREFSVTPIGWATDNLRIGWGKLRRWFGGNQFDRQSTSTATVGIKG